MNNKNLWRIIWVVGIYAVLVLILFLVIRYKVRWEDQDSNKYLYIYDCGETICSTETKVDTYIASIVCEDKVCPYIKEVSGNNIILTGKEKGYIFNLMSKKIINDNYLDYFFTSDGEAYIAVNSVNKYGVIDKDGNILVDFNYDKINDYKYELVLYTQDNMMGIDKRAGETVVELGNEKLNLFNDKLYIYIKDNEYYVNAYATKLPSNNSIYNYIYPYKDILLVSINNQIDVLDINLKSKLIMKINSYYPYTREGERTSLNPKGINNLLKFTVFTDDDNYTDYMYDIKSGKLYS